ncbi:MAG: tetratricopeptide repeat protein, partial [Bacteroidota bacterium]
LAVDPAQLKFLQAIQLNGPLSITVHHSQQGDIVEDLVIVCKSLLKVTKPAQEVDTTKVIAKDTVRKFIVSLSGKRENIDSTILREYTKPILIASQKESVDSSLHKEIAKTVSQPASKARGDSLLREEYADAVSLFREKKYEEAIAKFNSLLEKGIENTLAGNCEYWIGECNFATRDYNNAIGHFEKVIAIDASKKKSDAYFMLGKSYEQTGKREKARDVYQALNEQYPDNVHARRVESRLKALNNLLDEKHKTEDEIHE